MEDLKKFTVLIVDDVEVVRFATNLDFKKRGFTVLTAENGTEALKLVKNNKFDLVLSDIQMPNGDGISLLKAIQEYNATVPSVILMTGFSNISESECCSKGAKGVFVKPFDRKQLMDSVFDLLGIKKAI